MNTLVSREIVELLNKKGFTFNTSFVNAYDEKQIKHTPYISQVVMWLYEKHNIWIKADSILEGQWYFNVKSTIAMVGSKVTESGYYSPYHIYTTPSEAYSEAIKYTLNNLI